MQPEIVEPGRFYVIATDPGDHDLRVGVGLDVYTIGSIGEAPGESEPIPVEPGSGFRIVEGPFTEESDAFEALEGYRERQARLGPEVE
jgi:hypothetical protein